MQTLAEIIDLARSKADAPVSEEQKVINIIWEDAKNKLESYSKDYDSLIRKNAMKVKKTQIGNNARLILEMGQVNEYPLSLVVYVKSNPVAFYSMLDKVQNTAYVRYLTD